MKNKNLVDIDFIPQIQPWIDEEEVNEVAEVVRTTYITENSKTEEFLNKVKEFSGAKYAIAVGNGTLGLIAALLAENIGPGDEVIVPNLTFIATANAVKLVGAQPVFCDVDRKTGCISPDNFAHLVTEKTKVIMPVHLYGQVSPTEEILKFCDEHNLLLIEDAAESFGILENGIHTGTRGAYGIFSFFANKTITTGEGGVIFTNSEERYKKLYRIKNHGRDRKGVFIHPSIGYNFCFSDLQAAIGVAQLRKMDRIFARKDFIYNYYCQRLENVSGVNIIKVPNHIRSNHWFINVLVDNPEQFGEELKKRKIGTRRFFYPLHLQPCYEGDTENQEREYPNTMFLYEHGISLPSSVIITDDELEYVCDSIIEILS
jgi:perosamine synthetase